MRSSVVEHCLDTAGVTGSNPVAPTIFSLAFSRVTIVSQQGREGYGYDQEAQQQTTTRIVDRQLIELKIKLIYIPD